MRDLVVGAGIGWRSGRRVRIGMKGAERIGSSAPPVQGRLTRALARWSPTREDVAAIHRDHAQRLRINCVRDGHWR